MSIFSVGGRSATVRRISQGTLRNTSNPIKQQSQSYTISTHTMSRDSNSHKGRRRALDLYGTKDILFTHEQVKKTKQCLGNTSIINTFG